MSICNRQLQWTQALDLFQEVRENTKRGKNHMSNGKRDPGWFFGVYIGGMKSCPVIIRGSTNGKQDMVKTTCAIKVDQLLTDVIVVIGI